MSIVFQLTSRERDALYTLAACRAAWPTFDPRTWRSLVYKALVTREEKPELTDAGRALITFTRLLERLRAGRMDEARQG